MDFIERKGDVVFYTDTKGKLYQQLGCADLFPLRNGKMTYKPIQTVGKNVIKYNLNGVYGFSIFRGTVNLEDNIWTFADALRIAKELK